MTKRECKNGTEQDVVYARRIYCYLQRAGATSWWKRNMRRCERREGYKEIHGDW